MDACAKIQATNGGSYFTRGPERAVPPGSNATMLWNEWIGACLAKMDSSAGHLMTHLGVHIRGTVKAGTYAVVPSDLYDLFASAILGDKYGQRHTLPGGYWLRCYAEIARPDLRPIANFTVIPPGNTASVDVILPLPPGELFAQIPGVSSPPLVTCDILEDWGDGATYSLTFGSEITVSGTTGIPIGKMARTDTSNAATVAYGATSGLFYSGYYAITVDGVETNLASSGGMAALSPMRIESRLINITGSNQTVQISASSPNATDTLLLHMHASLGRYAHADTSANSGYGGRWDPDAQLTSNVLGYNNMPVRYLMNEVARFRLPFAGLRGSVYQPDPDSNNPGAELKINYPAWSTLPSATENEGQVDWITSQPFGSGDFLQGYNPTFFVIVAAPRPAASPAALTCAGGIPEGGAIITSVAGKAPGAFLKTHVHLDNLRGTLPILFPPKA